MRALLLALMMTLASWPAWAVDPDEILDDPVLEQRAREISAELRCLVCQNQSIDDSDAELARDLRIIVRERLVAGDSDAEVMQFVVDRYGEYVLLNPVLAPHTLLLWVAGPLILLVGGAVLFARSRRRSAPEDASPLTKEELAALEGLEAPPDPGPDDRPG
jgi:cytochrome c-type biogenesis protein CcmH